MKPSAPPLTRGELSLADSFRAACASTLTEKSHLKLVGVLFVITVPSLAQGCDNSVLSQHRQHRGPSILRETRAQATSWKEFAEPLLTTSSLPL